jgi:hypothetical protein
MQSLPRLYKESEQEFSFIPRVEVDSSICTAALSDTGGDEDEIQCRGYNWATLFVEDINMRTWPSRWISPESDTVEMVRSPTGHRPKNDCVEKGQ